MPTLASDEAFSLAVALINAAGLSDRVQVALRGPELLTISGPDGFGFLGSTAWQVLRIALPCQRTTVAVAVARHVFSEFYATDEEIRQRASEAPLALALAMGAEER